MMRQKPARLEPRPVAAAGDAAEGAGDPAFGRDQTAAEEFEEAAPRAGRHNLQKAGNSLSEAKGNETMKGHGGDSEKPKTLLIGRPLFTKGRLRSTMAVPRTFTRENATKNGFMHSEVGRPKSALHSFRAQPG